LLIIFLIIFRIYFDGKPPEKFTYDDNDVCLKQIYERVYQKKTSNLSSKVSCIIAFCINLSEFLFRHKLHL
jgi:hypothetical protein